MNGNLYNSDILLLKFCYVEGKRSDVPKQLGTSKWQHLAGLAQTTQSVGLSFLL